MQVRVAVQAALLKEKTMEETDNFMSFVKLDPKAELPTRATTGSAGYDLKALVGNTIKPNERLLVSTGIAWKNTPQSLVGLIKPRSGLAVRYGIDTLAGVIDSDYKGEINVLLVNLGQEPFTFKAGDRIAQLVLQQYFIIDDDETEEVREGGFGSTGE